MQQDKAVWGPRNARRTAAAGLGLGSWPLGQLMAVCTLRCSPLEMLTWLFSVSFDVLIGAIR